MAETVSFPIGQVECDLMNVLKKHGQVGLLKVQPVGEHICISGMVHGNFSEDKKPDVGGAEKGILDTFKRYGEQKNLSVRQIGPNIAISGMFAPTQ